MIVVIDYGLGNVGSIVNMLSHLGIDCIVSRQPSDIEQAKGLILPGVGAFDRGMGNLTQYGLIEPLQEVVVERGCPILGICLGAQLMTRESEEGCISGLGWLDIKTIKFFSRESFPSLKVPHMGWGTIEVMKTNPLIEDCDEHRFYFVHSYHFECESKEDVLASACYGYDFAAAFSKGNIYGVQFHPEKSHRFGKQLFTNFASWVSKI